MLEVMGSFWPTFQPYCAAICLPAIMLVRVLANACHCSSGITYSGYTSRWRCGSAQIKRGGVFSCHTPPNHCHHCTRATPGTASSFGTMLIGSAEVKDTRA